MQAQPILHRSKIDIEYPTPMAVYAIQLKDFLGRQILGFSHRQLKQLPTRLQQSKIGGI
jgi:hypothetical protein